MQTEPEFLIFLLAVVCMGTSALQLSLKWNIVALMTSSVAFGFVYSSALLVGPHPITEKLGATIAILITGIMSAAMVYRALIRLLNPPGSAQH